LGDVHAVAWAVGPHTEKVNVPVGDPAAAVPVTVAVSLTLLPREMLELLRTVVNVGVMAPVLEPVTSTHSVFGSLSVTGL